MTQVEIEAFSAIKGIRKELAQANQIDWEQRRYEIAKDMLCEVFNDSSFLARRHIPEAAREAVEFADALIIELQR